MLHTSENLLPPGISATTAIAAATKDRVDHRKGLYCVVWVSNRPPLDIVSILRANMIEMWYPAFYLQRRCTLGLFEVLSTRICAEFPGLWYWCCYFKYCVLRDFFPFVIYPYFVSPLLWCTFPNRLFDMSLIFLFSFLLNCFCEFKATEVVWITQRRQLYYNIYLAATACVYRRSVESAATVARMMPSGQLPSPLPVTRTCFSMARACSPAPGRCTPTNPPLNTFFAMFWRQQLHRVHHHFRLSLLSSSVSSGLSLD